MSGPYDQYPQQNQYGSPAPGYGQGYGQAPPQPSYGNDQYQQQNQYNQYPNQASPYDQSNAYQAPPQPSYDNQAGGYGPPNQGGFQHGQVAPYQDNRGGQDQYYPQNQQQPGYQPNSTASEQFPQQGAYNSQPYPGSPNDPQSNYGPTDPNAAQDGERGLMGAMAGGAAGYYGGKKAGGHTILGALAGAFAGHKLEEARKNSNNGKLW